MTFGEKLSSLRKQANLTQNDLANKLNVSRQAITKWEKGLGLPDVDNIKKIALLFNKQIDELLDYKIEEIKLELDTTKEQINNQNYNFKNVDKFILERFKYADSIEYLTREKKLTFWQCILDFFIGAGTLEMADMLGSGLVHSFLVKEGNNNYLVLINKNSLITKKMQGDFKKSIVIDGYKYSKLKKNNRIK